MTSKMKPAVGYIRMSTDKQEDSPAQQKDEITKLAQREGYRILRWYEDHGISGAKTLKRPEFRRMIREAEERGDFKAILCWDQDRFGRFDSIEAGEWVSPLRRVGVELVTVCQGRIDWDDFAGRLIYQITQEGKHRFLVDLSRNALRGMIRFAKEGHLLGMATPYGYDRMYFNAAGEEVCRIRRGERFHKPRDWTAKLVLSSNRQEVETIRWLFRTYATTSHSARWLAVDLNSRKVPSPNGKEWDWTHIKNLLRHPVYIGWLTYGRRGAGMYHHVGDDGELSTAQRSGKRAGEFAPIDENRCEDDIFDIFVRNPGTGAQRFIQQIDLKSSPPGCCHPTCPQTRIDVPITLTVQDLDEDCRFEVRAVLAGLNCCNTYTRIRILGSNGTELFGTYFSQSGYSQIFDARQVCGTVEADPP